MIRFTRESFPYFVLLLALYALFYGAILVYSNGMPYVTDGNESFSVLWHSHNLLNFDFGKSFGLTDEASAYHAAAHPYLHTHQGNMPRLFGAAIYALGARTVEAQIIVTTMLVGTACLALAYVSMRRLANPLFAFIFCALLITDYLQYAQWNVVTYRVWYAFLFYAVVYSIMRCGETGNRWAAAGLFGAYALLFYGELVFAGLLAIIGTLFTACWHRDRPRLVVRLWLVEFAGAAFSLGVLVTQLLAKFGPSVVRQDFTLTFVARNLSSDKTVQEATIEFFKEHGIVYLLNLSDASHLRTPIAFIKAQASNIFQLYTPWLVLVVAVVLGGFVVSLVLDRRLPADIARARGRFRLGVGELTMLGCVLAALVVLLPAGTRLGWGDMLLALATGVVAAEVGKRTSAKWRTTASSCIQRDALRALALATVAFVLLAQPTSMVVPARIAFAAAVFALQLDARSGYSRWPNARIDAALGGVTGLVKRATPFLAIRVALYLLLSAFLVLMLLRVFAGLEAFGVKSSMPKLGAPGILFTSVAAVFTSLAAGWALGTRWAKDSTPVGLKFLALVGFVGLVAVVIREQPRLYDQAYSVVWTLPFDMHEATAWGRATILAAVLLAFAFITFGWRRLLRPADIRPLIGPLAMLVIGEAAFAIIFFLAPGYVVSGYLGRSAPFAVFFTALPIAAVFYLLTVMALRARGAVFAWHQRRLRAVPRIGSQMRGPLLATSMFAAGILVLLSAYWVVLQSSYMGMLPPDHFAGLKELRKPPYAGQSSVANTYAAPIATMTGQWAYFDGIYFMNRMLLTESGYVAERDVQNYLWLADRDTNPDYLRPQLFICLWPQTLRNVVADMGRGFEHYENYCPRLPIVIDAAKGAGPMQHQLLAADLSPRGSWAIVRLDHEMPPLVEAVKMLVRPGVRLTAKIEYQYRQAAGTSEQHTLVELLGSPDSMGCDLSARPGVLGYGGPEKNFEIPDNFSGTIAFRVTPSSLRKKGGAVISNAFVVRGGRVDVKACPGSEASRGVKTVTRKFQNG